MTANTLRDKYGTWGEHPSYPSEDWKYEVEAGDTRRGYWDWVVAKLEQAEDL